MCTPRVHFTARYLKYLACLTTSGALISIFIGAVAALQFAFQRDGTLVPIYYIGYIVRDFAIIEASPTITALVLAGKVGSNMASEIGGMRQKEHIDAMEIMGVNTAAYLIMPRIVAALTVIPMLVALSAFISIFGGYLAVVPTGWMSDPEYVLGVRSFFDPYNFRLMFVKAFTFAFILTTVSCYQGYFVKSGSICPPLSRCWLCHKKRPWPRAWPSSSRRP